MFKLNRYAILATTFVLVLSTLSIAGAAEFSIKEEASGDIAILIDGELFTRYVTTDEITNKCYFWPVIGPNGENMTRAWPMEDGLPESGSDARRRCQSRWLA